MYKSDSGDSFVFIDQTNLFTDLAHEFEVLTDYHMTSEDIKHHKSGLYNSCSIFHIF